MIGTRTQSCLRSDQGRVCFPNTVPDPISGSLGSHHPQGGPERCWGQRRVCPGEKAAKERQGSVQGKNTKKPKPQTETKCVF